MKRYFVGGIILFLGFTAGATTYYVNLTNTVGAAAPYDTPATASTTIQAAVDQTVNGDTVQVADGYYVLTSEVLVTNDITLVSERSANSTVIDGQDNTRCFNMHIESGDFGELRGFLITNGKDYEGGGVRCYSSGTVIADCIFDHNHAAYGGGLYGGKAFDCIFTNNIADYEGGGMGGNGTQSAYNCTFVDNYADWNGGGLYYGYASDCIFRDNEAEVGAGMCSDGWAKRCSFINNTASHQGGAMFGMDFGKAYLCTVSNNTALVSGGGFENVEAYNSLIVSNAAPKGGGAYKSELNNCTISENTAENGGGVNDCSLTNSIIWYNTASVSGSDIKDSGDISYCCSLLLTNNVDGNITDAPLFINRAAGNFRLSSSSTCINAGTNNFDGGTEDLDGNPRLQGHRVDIGAYETSLPETSVYVSVDTGNDANDGQSWATAKKTIQAAIDIATDTVRVSNGVYLITHEISTDWACHIVSENGPKYTTVDGGEVTRCFNLAAFSTLSGFTVTGGSTSGNGGGINCVDSTTIVTNCIITSNYAHGGGGMESGTANDCTFSNNTAYMDGGGQRYGEANHCCFTENHAGESGGGICYGDASDCVFSKNTALNGGGIRHGWSVDRCTFSMNRAAEAGGGARDSDISNSFFNANHAGDEGGGMYDCNAENCTLTGNSAEDGGGGICDGTAVNCIIWNNTASSSNNFANAELTYCASPELTNGVNHNINQDPLFIYSYHISTNSPCIAAGNSAAANGTDLDGEPWQTSPSIGCDEVVPGSVTGEITLSISGPTNIAVGTSGNYTIHVIGAVTRNILSFSDGEGITNTLTSVNHTWNTTGNESVTLTAFNDDYPAGVSQVLSVSVLSAAESSIYVDGSNGSDANDGSSWSFPKKTIQAGVDAQSIENGWIIVSNGTYSISTAISVDKPVHIKSLNGLKQTVIAGPGYDLDFLAGKEADTGRCFWLNNNRCILSGLTLTGGGVVCEEDSSCVVSNCLFIENTAYYGGGLCSGNAIDCTFLKNSAYYGGGMCSGNAMNCTFQQNSAMAGGGMYNCTATRCTFVDNLAFLEGGGMLSGTANSSLFTGNTASGYGGGTSHVTANQCNIIGNSALVYGATFGGTANNCIAWDNEALYLKNLSGSSTHNCCSPDLDHGVDGNITNAPLLISAAHIATNSPCIGAGNPLYVTAADYDGESWQSIPAIGCDAVQSGAVAGSITLSIIGPTNSCTGVAAPYIPIIHGGVTRTILTFSDGVSITNAILPTQHIWSSLGSKTVTIQAFNDDYPTGLSYTLPVQVSSVEATTIYVSGLTGSDSNDGSSWATAKQSIQAGVDTQDLYGGRILVTNGTYSVTNEIYITKPIQLISVNGAVSTIVDGGNSNRCFNLGNSDCLISGFTITRGYAVDDHSPHSLNNGDGGGVFCLGKKPQITECVITENNADYSGGGLYMGRISRSHISENNAGYGGGLFGSEAENCVIVKNSVNNDGGGVFKGVSISCTIADNSAHDEGGGTIHSFAFNSIIWNNTSTNGNSDITSTICQSCCSPTLTNNVDGNINQAPLFISRDDNNYQIQPDSPCIDAGANKWSTSSLDFAGAPRISNGTIDVGAFEVTPIYVSDADGNDSYDGKSWATAKKTIQAGINAQNLANGIVLVASGTYLPTSTITSSQSVSLIAPQGAETTIINGGGSIRCFDLGSTATLIKGFTITNGFTTGDGGGVYAESEEATLDECIISGNTAYSGGGVHECTLTRCILRGNSASNAGGALWSSTANNCIIEDNTAALGGGMYASTANNCTIISNSATRGGGIDRGTANNSIIWDNSASTSNNLYETTARHCCSPVLADTNGNTSDNPRFKNLAAGDYHLLPGSPCIDSGTNLYVETSTDLDGETRIQNDVVDMGVYELSAIYVATTGSDSNDGSSWAKAKLTLQAGVDLAQDGDLVWVDEGTYLLSTKVIITNSVTLYGGTNPENTIVDGDNRTACFDLADTAATLSGLTITRGRYRAIECADGTPVLTNCLISANAGNALYKGTAISCTFSNNVGSSAGGAMRDGAAINCLFIQNSASTSAGAMYNGIANNCSFIANSAHSGGAIYSVTASNCTFTANTASNSGGASSQSSLFNCTLRNNSSLGFGGALYYGTANNCILINNSASTDGGGMHSATANNCVFSGNQAHSGGGGGMYSGTANNCTFTENSAFEGGGMTRATVNNCILWNNSAEEQGDNLLYSTARYSCSPDVTDGSSGCITNNPLLVSASHIATNSPCIGRGSAQYTSGTDLDGENWQATPSMGCDELIGSTVSGPILPLLTVPERICSGYAATLDLFFEGAVTRTTIDFGDGSGATNMSSIISHTWSLGNYEVILTGYNDDHPTGVSVTNVVYIRTASSTAIYVSDATGNDADDGSIANPKKTIQAGVDAQDVEGGFVYVADGTYAITSEILIDKNIRLYSQNNAEVTIIESDGTARCFNLKSSRCIVNGFTITGSGGQGEESTGGAVHCSGTRPLVSNCILTENTGPSPSAMQGGTASHCSFMDNVCNGNGAMKNGIAEYCTFSGNTSAGYAGAIYDCVARFSTFQDNSAQYSGAQYGGKATQCKFIRNIASKSGGATYNGTVINSTLQGNFAAEYGGGSYNGTAINSTFCDNRAANGGGSYGTKVYNCILWNNTATIEGNNCVGTTVSYSCAPELTSGEDGNITADPLLLSPSHIATNSPCVGVGSALYAEGSDIDGDEWNTLPSMGCDEISPPMQGSITLSISGPSTVCAGFPATFTFIVEGEIIRSTVRFGDGDTIYNPITTTLQHTWDTPGSYVILATALNENTVAQEFRFDVDVVDAAATAIYVAPNGSDSSAGTNWPTAKQTIQGGIDAQDLTGGQIIVSNGVYTLEETIQISKTIQLIALSGAEETVIDADSNRALEIGDLGCSIDGFTIRNAQASETGGAIYCDSTTPQISNCIFADNTAGTAGGMFGGTAIDCIFTNCSAISGMGGGLYAGMASNTLFTQNYARNGGGGMYYGLATDCTFIGNETPKDSGYGGGMRGGTATTCTFQSNVSGYGGGLADGTANECNFFENTALYRGGGAEDSTLTRCALIGNTALQLGGGAFSGTANSCLFTANSAEENGGAIYSGTANQCTITGNRAGETGGGMEHGYANNCIVWGNTAGISGDDMDSVSAAHNTCSPDLTDGSNGCITNNPLLITASHLSASSPCIGRGSDEYAIGTDIDGESWLSPPSMGCDEPSLTGAVEMALIGPTSIFKGVSADYTALFNGPVNQTIIDFADGTRITNAVGPIAHSWAAPGSFDVVLSAFNNDYPQGTTFTQSINVASSATTIYVALNGNDASNGLSWATAKATIQAGVDAQSIYGGQVVISNGTYNLSEAIEINTPIHLLGQGTSREVLIDAGGSNRCFILGYQASVLDNLIITNGATATQGYNTNYGGGINCAGYAPVITNCWITGCLSYKGGGIYKGTVIDSALMNNTAVGYGGALSKSRVFHSEIINNHASYGGGASESQLERCLISGNIASTDGGGIYSYSSSGFAQNCDIRNNTATNHGGGSCSASYGGPLKNCTVVGNTADYGGGIYGGDTFNCIVWYNNASRYTNMSSSADSSCSPDLKNGYGHYNNITNAPSFINRAGGDYRLSHYSPCLNAGDNQYVTAENDFDGTQRIQYGVVDMGAYELNLGTDDSDGDGMPDSWELENFGNIIIAEATEDADTDTFDNHSEYIAGTDPHDDTSYLRITQSDMKLQGTNTQVTLTWEPSVEGRAYSVQWSTNLVDGFQTFSGSLLYPDDQVIFDDDQPKAFYKISVQLDN